MSDASNFSYGVDLSFAVIFGISIFFLVGITAVMIYFVIRYRRKKNPKATNIHGNNKLEIIWTVIPTLLVLVMFYYGWVGYKPMRSVPDDAIPITVYGQMWSWQFEYPNGKKSGELVIPKDVPVKLDLVSRDVIHSFYIPAFRVKEDVVPGKNNFMWFIAQEEGSYDIFCAEYCGERHAYMLAETKVVPQAEYEEWLTKSDIPEDQPPGLTHLQQNACLTCHSLDGSRLIGPTFRGIYGKSEVVITEAGEEMTITVDDDYLVRSIYEPNAEIVKGYNKGLMISYKSTLSDQQVQEIIDYIKTLN
jgi:cytochrome c oxidase subunit 2